MLGRIFGRGKDEPADAVCSDCGRTLLAGEWTQKVVDEDGEERLLCSLCGREMTTEGPPSAAAPPMTAPSASAPATESPVQPDVEPGASAEAPAPPGDDRAESDAFWKALKERDAHIEELQAQVARLEAERQELAGQLAMAHAAAAPLADAATEDAGEIGEPVVAEVAEQTFDVPAPVDDAPEHPFDAEIEQGAVRPHDSAVFAPEPHDTFSGLGPAEAHRPEAPAAEAHAAPPVPAPVESPAIPSVVHEDTAPMPALEEEPAAVAAPAPDALTSAEAASLTLLQRGVDLLNVSPVPHKIAETNADLGIPAVHVGFDGSIVAVTFLWPLGWYRFHVDLEGSGAVSLDERGYDERSDLVPNASVRADGTVQLAPARISRAAREPAPETDAQPSQPEGGAAEPATAEEPATPRDAAEKAPEIVSQSLLGQRTDDEPNPWDGTQAREFSW